MTILLVVPVAEGVPDIAPEELIVKPEGRDPEVIAHAEYVPLPPVALIWNV